MKLKQKFGYLILLPFECLEINYIGVVGGKHSTFLPLKHVCVSFQGRVYEEMINSCVIKKDMPTCSITLT